MSLCTLCAQIPFGNIPSLPSHYAGHIIIRKPIYAFASPTLGRTREASKSSPSASPKPMEELDPKFSEPTRLPHQPSLEVKKTNDAIEKARNDKVLGYQQDRQRYPEPDSGLWIAKRKDGGEGFVVLSYSDPGRPYILAAVGFCVEEDDSPLSSTLPGRVIEEDPSSEKVLSRPIRWIEECNKAHKKCVIGDVPLPLRVLDVECDGAPDRVRLYEPNGQLGRYTTLSHVWGRESTKNFTTTLSTMDERKTGIAVNELPKTFQDAIFLTRRLGICYLWIESICICQDDGRDWERESARMASIYANSFLTIAATGSIGDSDGCLTARPRREYAEIEFHSQGGVSGKAQAFGYPVEHAVHEKSWCVLAEEPLSKRGWSLQERYLTSRTLHFARDQLFFECHGHFLSEDGLHVNGRHSSVDESFHPNEVKPQAPYRGPWLWWQILHSYNHRALTKDSDTLPALTGIAWTFEGKTGDKYMAGLWKNSLIEGLAWQAMRSPEDETDAPAEYRAPSWSWASINGIIANMRLGEEGYEGISEGKTEWENFAEVIDCHVEPKEENPHGGVKSGWIKLKAPIEPLSLSEKKEMDWETIPFKRHPRMKTRTGDPWGALCMFDTLNSDVAVQLPRSALILTQGYTARSEKTVQALIVTPAEGEIDHYRRTGKDFLSETSLGKCAWMEDDEQKRVITIV